jgi:aerobic carbon-monoxide dehydrogenase medium subunit
MRPFDYLQPNSIEEASSQLNEYGDDARVFAGGTALMLVMRQRMLNPKVLVSLDRLSALRGITFDAISGLRIGALSLHAYVAEDANIRQHYPMLAHMAKHLANPQVRNQGTIGGNLCYADPATDPPGCLMALGATVVLQSARGQRTLAMEDFLTDYYTTALASDELLVAITLPPPSAQSVGRYTRFRRTAAEHRPILNMSFHALNQGPDSKSDESRLSEIRLVVAASTPVPTRLTQAESLLAAEPVTKQLLVRVAKLAAEEANVISDQRGSEDYRRQMLEVVTRRTLEAALGLDQSL